MSQINPFVRRRDFLKLAGMTSLGFFWHLEMLADVHTVNPEPVSSDEALKRLLDGNGRFVQQKRKYPDQSLQRLQVVAQAQYPFAAVLGCADSRVPAEIVFDQGIGDLFVVRVAGNVASDMVIGSLEYSTAVLGCGLIVVLGHERCGAVTQALQSEALPGRIGYVVEGIKPALERVKLKTGDITENGVLANIGYQAEKLQEKSTILAKLIREGKLKVVGARYDMDTGKVSVVS